MKLFKIILIYIFLIVQVAPVQSSAQVSLGRFLINQYSEDPYTIEQLDFLAHYKAYVKRIVQIRASIIKKKIVCLGYTPFAHLGIDDVKDEEVKSSLQALVSEYHHSEECENFLSKLPELHAQYSEMKVLLSLHKSSKWEVTSKALFSSLGEGMLLQGAAYGQTFSDDDRVYDIFRCDEIQAPLMIDRVDFCLKKLKTILNIEPDHVVNKISLGAVDDIISSRNIPEIEQVGFLNWNEVVTAVDRFKDYYINSDDVNQGLFEWASSGSSHMTARQGSDDRFRKYFTAAGYQAQGMYIFSEYPEGSAPLAYAQILAELPILGFYRPQVNSYEIDCENVERNMHEICRRYAAETGNSSFEYNTDQGVLKYQFARAYEKMLLVVNSLIERMDVDFDSSVILNTDLEVRDDVDSSDLGEWKKLIRLKGALASYEEKYPTRFAHGEIFINKVRRDDIIIAALTLAGIVAASIGCGFVGGLVSGGTASIAAAGGCVLVTGLGVNGVFYYKSHKEYEEGIEDFFSNPTNFENGDSLSLTEFGSMKSNAQAIMLDTYMFGVGTGIGQVIVTPAKNTLINMVRINRLGELL